MAEQITFSDEQWKMSNGNFAEEIKKIDVKYVNLGPLYFSLYNFGIRRRMPLITFSVYGGGLLFLSMAGCSPLSLLLWIFCFAQDSMSTPATCGLDELRKKYNPGYEPLVPSTWVDKNDADLEEIEYFGPDGMQITKRQFLEGTGQALELPPASAPTVQLHESNEPEKLITEPSPWGNPNIVTRPNESQLQPVQSSISTAADRDRQVDLIGHGLSELAGRQEEDREQVNSQITQLMEMQKTILQAVESNKKVGSITPIAGSQTDAQTGVRPMGFRDDSLDLEPLPRSPGEDSGTITIGLHGGDSVTMHDPLLVIDLEPPKEFKPKYDITGWTIEKFKKEVTPGSIIAMDAVKHQSVKNRAIKLVYECQDKYDRTSPEFAVWYVFGLKRSTTCKEYKAVAEFCRKCIDHWRENLRGK